MVFLRVILCACLCGLGSVAQAATVILYHHVSNTMPPSTSISPERFIAQMDYLAANHFHIVPLEELTELVRKGEPLPDKTVAITFDDAYADVYTSAYPILKKRGWPFTFFVNTAAVSTGKIFVTWDELREMSHNGVTIANHTTRHDHIVRMNAGETEAQWQARITGEIRDAQQKLEQEIGRAPNIFAYPFGEYDAGVKKILRDLGYIAFTQQAGVLDLATDKQTLPRFPFGGSFTELNDFIEKINTLPMPVSRVEFYADKSRKLDNLVVKAGDNPYLVLSLSNNQLLSRVHCFSSNEGPIAVEQQDNKLWIRGRQPFPAGRTKINCTAPSQERGRFYWYTQLWLVTDKNGVWTYQD